MLVVSGSNKASSLSVQIHKHTPGSYRCLFLWALLVAIALSISVGITCADAASRGRGKYVKPNVNEYPQAITKEGRIKLDPKINGQQEELSSNPNSHVIDPAIVNKALNRQENGTFILSQPRRQKPFAATPEQHEPIRHKIKAAIEQTGSLLWQRNSEGKFTLVSKSDNWFQHTRHVEGLTAVIATAKDYEHFYGDDIIKTLEQLNRQLSSPTHITALSEISAIEVVTNWQKNTELFVELKPLPGGQDNFKAGVNLDEVLREIDKSGF